MNSRSSGTHIIFPAVMLILTGLLVGIGWWSWQSLRQDLVDELSDTANLLKSYYSLTFSQRELGLRSIGQRLSEISGDGYAEERLRVLNQTLALYDDLSAIGFADTTGQILTLTGTEVDDVLPNLSQGDATRRSFNQAKRSTGMVIGEIYYFDITNDWIIPIRIPVRNTDGNVIAVNTSGVTYESMTKNLQSFGLSSYLSIQIINTSYGSTQFYYPLEEDMYYSVLQNNRKVLSDYQLVESQREFTKFTALNEITQKRVLGIQSAADKFNFTILVTAPEKVIEDRWWKGSRYYFGLYFLTMLLCIMAYWYYTQREKQYTGELQEERDYSNQIIGSTPALIIGLDSDLICTYANPAAETILGYNKKELIGLNWWETVLKHISANEVPKRYNLLAERTLKNELISCVNAQGDLLQISWNSVNLYNGEGETDKIFLFGNDQTEKEATTEKLKEREANLFGLIESTSSLIGLLNNEKQLLEYNQSFAKYANFAADITLAPGVKVADMLEEPYCTMVNGFLDRCLQGEIIKEIIDFEGGGQQFYFMLNIHPIYKDDTVVGASMFIEDITELKKSQEELRKYSENLKSLVEERTKELKSANVKMRTTNNELKTTLAELQEAQGKLIENEKMASLGILSAGIGHEINNPLNFIKNGATGLSKVLQDDQNPDQNTVDMFIKIIEEGVSRASNIVKSLSHFSRTGENMSEDCEVGTIIENSLTILHNKLKHKVEVKKTFNHEGVSIPGNEGKLHQAILNLLTNAEQSIEGKGTIEITTKTKDNHLILTIGDTGSGIPSEIIGKITDPFFTTKDPGKGTGLGLSITYSIIKEHNGDITVSSKIGKGTIFTIHLPIKKIA
jgi:PAS domain S-box-containing protein